MQTLSDIASRLRRISDSSTAAAVMSWLVECPHDQVSTAVGRILSCSKYSEIPAQETRTYHSQLLDAMGRKWRWEGFQRVRQWVRNDICGFAVIVGCEGADGDALMNKWKGLVHEAACVESSRLCEFGMDGIHAAMVILAHRATAADRSHLEYPPPASTIAFVNSIIKRSTEPVSEVLYTERCGFGPPEVPVWSECENLLTASAVALDKMAQEHESKPTQNAHKGTNRKSRENDAIVLWSALMSWHGFSSDEEKRVAATQKELLGAGLSKMGWDKFRLSRAFKALFGGMKTYKRCFLEPSKATLALQSALKDPAVKRMAPDDLTQ